MAKILWSVFTSDMDHCFITGLPGVERHHIIGKTKYNKMLCEEYGYIVPVIPRLHPNGAQADAEGRALDIVFKQMAQRDFEAKHGTREEFIRLFGKSYLED